MNPLLQRFLGSGTALVLALAAGAVTAHDTWFRALPSPRSGEALLLLGTGNRFPVQEYAVGAEHLSLSGCRSDGVAGTLAPLQLTSQALLLRATAPAGGASLSCWAQLEPFEAELSPELIEVYLDEIAAPPAVRTAWAAMQARGVKWRERYTKHARIELGPLSSPRPVERLGMDVLLSRRGAQPQVGDELSFQVLRDGQPLAGFAVEMRSTREDDAVWLATDAAGRVNWRPPAAGDWVLRGTDLRPVDGERWESRFVTLAFQVAAAGGAAPRDVPAAAPKPGPR